MSSPTPLQGRHRQYKYHTDQLSDWVAKTASRYCQIKKIVRFLGSSRNRQDVAKGAKVELLTAEYVTLAQIIAEAKPGVKVPRSILRSTKEAIRLRQECASFYAQASMKENGVISKSDSSHQHFVDMLQRVHDILESTWRRDAAALPPSCSGTVAPEESQEDLDEYWPSEEAVATSGHGGKGAQDMDLSGAEFTTEEQPYDTIFEVWCFFQDINDVRFSILETWQQYRKGELTFMAAGMTAVNGLALIKCACSAFAVAHPLLEYHDRALAVLGLVTSMDGRTPTVYIAHKESHAADEQNQDNIADFVCAAGQAVVEIYQQNCSRLRKNWSHRHRETLQEGVSEDEEMWRRSHPFLEALFDYTWAIDNIGPQLGFWRLDDFVRDLAKKRVTTFLVFASQIHLETFEMLGPIARSNGVDLVKSSLDAWQHAGDIEPEHIGQFETGESKLHMVSDIASSVSRAKAQLEADLSDWRRGDVCAAAFSSQQDESTKLQARFVSGLESCLPLHAISTAFDIKTNVYEKGCRIVNRGAIVDCVMFLYKAARHTGLLKDDWQDMITFILSQNRAGTPTPSLRKGGHLDQFRVQFEAMIGFHFEYYISKGTWPKFDPSEKPQPFGKGAEYVRELQKLCEQYKPQVAKGEHQGTLPEAKLVEMVLHRMRTDDAKKADAKETQRFGKAATESHMFSPAELLSTFKKSFIKDEIILNFDYVQFYEQCSSLLEVLLVEMNRSLGEKYFTCASIQPWQLTQKVLRQLGESNPDKLQETTLAKLVPLMSDHIKTHGKSLSKQASDQSSGRIPKPLKPSFPVEEAQDEPEQVAQLRRAGTSVSFNGEIVTLYHPKLKEADLNLRILDSGIEHAIIVPWYMLKSEEEYRAKGGKDDRTTDGFYMAWHRFGSEGHDNKQAGETLAEKEVKPNGDGGDEVDKDWGRSREALDTEL